MLRVGIIGCGCIFTMHATSCDHLENATLVGVCDIKKDRADAAAEKYNVSLMWNSGVQIILFLIGIQKIPQELYEAARVDSATEWEIFWKITLPMISPIILLVIVYTIISANAEYGPVISYIMWQGFDMSEFEYAAAMGWSFFAVMLVIIGLVFLVMKPFINRVTKRD